MTAAASSRLSPSIPELAGLCHKRMYALVNIVAGANVPGDIAANIAANTFAHPPREADAPIDPTPQAQAEIMPIRMPFCAAFGSMPARTNPNRNAHEAATSVKALLKRRAGNVVRG